MSEQLKVRAGAVEWRQLDGEIVALDLRRSLYLGINPSGTALWQDLVEGATREELVERLRDDFGLSPEAAVADVDSFLDELAQHDLLEA